MNVKGTLPILILKILGEAPRHGYDVAREIKCRSEGLLDFREGTLYPALHALENQGRIESDERVVNGRTRRCYRLTDEGQRVLESEKNDWRRLAGAIDAILEGA